MTSSPFSTNFDMADWETFKTGRIRICGGRAGGLLNRRPSRPESGRGGGEHCLCAGNGGETHRGRIFAHSGNPSLCQGEEGVPLGHRGGAGISEQFPSSLPVGRIYLQGLSEDQEGIAEDLSTGLKEGPIPLSGEEKERGMRPGWDVGSGLYCRGVNPHWVYTRMPLTLACPASHAC